MLRRSTEERMEMVKEDSNICRICKKTKELTFEHIPPRSAFNKNVRYYEIPHEEYWTNCIDYAINGKPYGKKYKEDLEILVYVKSVIDF